MITRRFTRIAAVMGILVVSALALVTPAQAALVALSVNITDSGNLVAGTAGVNAAGTGWSANGSTGFNNWNNLYSGAPNTLGAVNWLANTFTPIGALRLSDGSVAGNIRFKLQRGPDFNLSAGGGAMTGGNAGDQALMRGGPRTYILTSTANSFNIRMQITGLTSVFTSGYTVRAYTDYMSNNVGSGTIWVSPNAADYAIGELNTTGFNTAGTTFVNYGNANNATFNGDFGIGGHYVSSLAPSGGVGQDTLVITDQLTGGGSTTAFAQSVWTGFQIIGDVVTTTSTKYTQTADTVANSSVIVGGSTTFNSKITNTGTGTDDTLNYTGLSATVTGGGSIIGGPGNGGPLAQSATGTQGLTYNSTGSTFGAQTLTPTISTATNATLGGSATFQGPATTASVNVLAHSNGDFGNVSGVATPTFGLNSLTLDFGTVLMSLFPIDSSFDVFNTINTPGFTAAMDLDTNVDTTGVGDTTRLFRFSGLTTFLNQPASLPGGGQPYTFRLDRSTPGVFSATYQFLLSDQSLPGATAPNSEVLTLTLLANVIVPEPSTWALGILGSAGLLAFLFARRRRDKS